MPEDNKNKNKKKTKYTYIFRVLKTKLSLGSFLSHLCNVLVQKMQIQVKSTYPMLYIELILRSLRKNNDKY